MLLFRVAHQIGRKTDLRFDFLLAVPVIVVCDQRDGHPRCVAAGDFERAAVVVAFRLLFPAHRVFPLTIGRLVPVWKPDFFLGQRDEMGCQNHATGVTAP